MSQVLCSKKQQQHLLNADMDVCTHNTHTHPPIHTHPCTFCVHIQIHVRAHTHTHTHTHNAIAIYCLVTQVAYIYRGAKYTHSGCVTDKADLIEE